MAMRFERHLFLRSRYFLGFPAAPNSMPTRGKYLADSVGLGGIIIGYKTQEHFVSEGRFREHASRPLV
jgi:hypothetical protein